MSLLIYKKHPLTPEQRFRLFFNCTDAGEGKSFLNYILTKLHYHLVRVIKLPVQLLHTHTFSRTRVHYDVSQNCTTYELLYSRTIEHYVNKLAIHNNVSHFFSYGRRSKIMIFMIYRVAGRTINSLT